VRAANAEGKPFSVILMVHANTTTCFVWWSRELTVSHARALWGDQQDLHMPEMDGITATRMIKQEEQERSGTTRPPPYIIACTADLQYGTRKECRQAGMDGYLPKVRSPLPTFSSRGERPPRSTDARRVCGPLVNAADQVEGALARAGECADDHAAAKDGPPRRPNRAGARHNQRIIKLILIYCRIMYVHCRQCTYIIRHTTKHTSTRVRSVPLLCALVLCINGCFV